MRHQGAPSGAPTPDPHRVHLSRVTTDLALVEAGEPVPEVGEVVSDARVVG